MLEDRSTRYTLEQTSRDLIEGVRTLNGRTCLDLAIRLKSLDLIAHPACQELLNAVWFGRINEKRTKIGVVLAALFFPPLIFAISFKQEKIKRIANVCIRYNVSKINLFKNEIKTGTSLII